MHESILNFNKQFSFEPDITEYSKPDNTFNHFIVGGMGGSHLTAGLLQIICPEKEIFIHRDYGIPKYEEKFLKESLFIASSYSGNTEEVLDFAEEVYSRGLNLFIITKGGKLLDFATENNINHIVLPQDNIQPRVALGYSILALSKIVAPEISNDLKSLESKLDPAKLENLAEEIFGNFKDKTPIIYSSRQNRHIAYNWKIKMNETGKIPAFYNQIPELNHNEMQGYDFIEKNSNLSEKFYFVILKDTKDDQRIQKRINVMQGLLEEKGFGVLIIDLLGDNIYEKIFNSLLLADFVSLKIANYYGTEPNDVPLIEEFKKRLK